MILRALNITFLLIILSFFYQKANTGNFYNWDAIAYTMAVQLDEGKSTDEAHEYTYKTLKNEVDPGLFQTLCCTGKYRQDQFDSPGNLKSMMPMYALKPGYIALIKAVKTRDTMISLIFIGAINRFVKFLLQISSKNNILNPILVLNKKS